MKRPGVQNNGPFGCDWDLQARQIPYDGPMKDSVEDHSQAAPEQPIFETLNSGGQADILLVCDHASNALPPEYGTLGLDRVMLQRHIGYDIGAADVTRRLCGLIDAPAVLSGFSRLLVDYNRQPGDPTSIPTVSDHVRIPANEDLPDGEAARRLKTYFEPYHAAVEAALDGFAARGVVPAIFAIHSFTPVMDGFERPWHIGFLWNQDTRLAAPMVDALNAYPGVVVGENQPYAGSDPSGYSIHIHGEERGCPALCVEIRQDLIDTHHGAEEWAGRLAGAIKDTIRQTAPYQLEPNSDWESSIIR